MDSTRIKKVVQVELRRKRHRRCDLIDPWGQITPWGKSEKVEEANVRFTFQVGRKITVGP